MTADEFKEYDNNLRKLEKLEKLVDDMDRKEVDRIIESMSCIRCGKGIFSRLLLHRLWL
jgi:hypothetical protein